MMPSGVYCKGDWSIGTACGDCEKCLTTARPHIERLRAELERLREMFAPMLNPTPGLRWPGITKGQYAYIEAVWQLNIQDGHIFGREIARLRAPPTEAEIARVAAALNALGVADLASHKDKTLHTMALTALNAGRRT